MPAPVSGPENKKARLRLICRAATQSLASVVRISDVLIALGSFSGP